MDILITGSVGYDYIMDFSGRFADRIMPEALHKLSLSFLVDTLNKQLGGTAGNLAYSLKLLGVEGTIIAPVGNDFSQYRSFMEKHHISTRGIAEYQDEQTSSYFGITDSDDNQIGSFYVGAMKYAKNAKLSSFVCTEQPLVILGPIDPAAMVQFAAECIDNNYPYLYDPAFQIANLSAEDLRRAVSHASILIGNDYEIMLIEKQLGISHETLLKMVPIVITTLGVKGSTIETGNELISIAPAAVSNASDPTGAGDAYRGGFLAGYTRGMPLKTCGQMGSVAASYTVEKYGTMTHSYTEEEFARRYEENYHEQLSLTI